MGVWWRGVSVHRSGVPEMSMPSGSLHQLNFVSESPSCLAGWEYKRRFDDTLPPWLLLEIEPRIWSSRWGKDSWGVAWVRDG